MDKKVYCEETGREYGLHKMEEIAEGYPVEIIDLIKSEEGLELICNDTHNETSFTVRAKDFEELKAKFIKEIEA